MTDLSEVFRPLVEKAQDEIVANLDATGRGVRTGLMRSELQNRANVVVSQTAAGLVIPGSIRERFDAFNNGVPGRQPPRPILGLSPQLRAQVSQQINRATRDQLVGRIKSRRATP